jgi:hypothetical protein
MVNGMMSVRAYAKHRGVRHSAVQRAIEVGRLCRSVVRDAKGRASITDVAAADREWEATTRTDRVPLSVQLSKLAGTADERAPLVARLLEIAAELQADSRAALAEYLPDAIGGAAEALQALGRPTTPAGISAALGLDAGLDGWALLLTDKLLGAVGSPDLASDEIRALARQEGREAALGYPRLGIKEATDGDAR